MLLAFISAAELGDFACDFELAVSADGGGTRCAALRSEFTLSCVGCKLSSITAIPLPWYFLQRTLSKMPRPKLQ